MSNARFSPEAGDEYDRVIAIGGVLADRLDAAIDWIESDPPDKQAKARVWAGGFYGIDVRTYTDELLIIWRETSPEPTIDYIGKPL